MKKIAKKNQIVIATLAVMIAAAVYELLGQIISEQAEDTGDQF